MNGINLTLMIGPAVPVPVGRDVLDALTAVQVTSAAGQTSGFQLTFDLTNRSPLGTLFLLSGGAAVPLVRVLIVVTIGGTPEVLMDGVMTNHQVTPGSQAGHSTLIVTGEDLSKVMDYIDFSGIPYPCMPLEARVLMILAKYAMFGIAPMVIPTLFSDVPLPTDRIPRQQGKDLEYIRQLATSVGYVFYVQPGPAPGMSVAYWGPEVKVGIPQPALNTDMDALTNVESLSFSFSADARNTPVVYIQEPISKFPIPIPIPDVSLLNPPLGLIPPLPMNFTPLNDTANRSAMSAVGAGLAEAARSSDALTANGSLNVLRYGHVLKSRGLVGVRGAGTAFDGLYYVKSVTHNIRPGEYKQSFSLTRNGLVSTLPVVPV